MDDEKPSLDGASVRVEQSKGCRATRSLPKEESQQQQRARAKLVANLRGRFPEIKAALLSQIRDLAVSSDSQDPEYVAGLRGAVGEILGYGLKAIEDGDEQSAVIPSSAAAQARRAARNGVSLDTVLRRYAAGDRLIVEVILDDVGQLPSEVFMGVLRAKDNYVDRLMAVASAEYNHEIERMGRSPEQQLTERVQALLCSNSQVDVSDFDYEFDGWHLGMVAIGSRAQKTVRALAAHLDCQALVVPRGKEHTWAWLGRAHKSSDADVEQALTTEEFAETSLAIGEWRGGLSGWRLTHHEAQAALSIMLRKPQSITRCRNVILLTGMLPDETLRESLRETYLAPLDGFADSGKVLRETVRAYFDSGFNAVAAAATLNVDRHTVQRRLRKVESALGHLLPSCHAELEVALRLEELDRCSTPGHVGSGR